MDWHPIWPLFDVDECFVRLYDENALFTEFFGFGCGFGVWWAKTT